MSQNRASDQGLRCLLTDCNIKNLKQFTNKTNIPKIENGLVHLEINPYKLKIPFIGQYVYSGVQCGPRSGATEQDI